MRSLFRGLAGALLILGLAALTTSPAELAAQAKKDTKDPKAPAKTDAPKPPDPTKDKTIGITTSDGLSLNAYWFQGQAVDKSPPDAVMMFPAPGEKVNDAWIGLAKALSEKNFSVLLFDWRGCGMNAAATAGQRIFADKDVFWRETYNRDLLRGSQRTIEDKGLDWSRLKSATNNRLWYSDFMFNDLLAARFYLDRQNDNGKCNSGRIWIVTDKTGGQAGLAFIASEFARNSMYDPKPNVGTTTFQFRSGGKDFVGMTVLSFASGNSSANAIFRNSMAQLTGTLTREAPDHLEHRLAMVMLFGKKEGPSASRSAFSLVGAGGDEDALKKNFKYLREIDNSKQAKPISGIDLIDPMDSFGVQKTIVDSMVGVSKALPTNKDRIERDANKMASTPRFRADTIGRR